MKAVAYCRVSTLGQSEDGVSLAMQQDRVAAWCVGNGYELTQVFTEAASGGRLTNRPEAQKAVASACKMKGVLVVYSLSRLARSVKDTLEIAERLDRAGANLASLTERIDTASALGKMVFRLLSTLNEFERDQLSERTSGAMAHLRRENRRISGRVPLGYVLQADGETLAIAEDEQRLISRISDMREGGMTLPAIARCLRNEGVRTKRGGAWHPATVRAILVRRRKLAA